MAAIGWMLPSPRQWASETCVSVGGSWRGGACGCTSFACCFSKLMNKKHRNRFRFFRPGFFFCVLEGGYFSFGYSPFSLRVLRERGWGWQEATKGIQKESGQLLSCSFSPQRQNK